MLCVLTKTYDFVILRRQNYIYIIEIVWISDNSVACLKIINKVACSDFSVPNDRRRVFVSIENRTEWWILLLERLENPRLKLYTSRSRRVKIFSSESQHSTFRASVIFF